MPRPSPRHLRARGGKPLPKHCRTRIKHGRRPPSSRARASAKLVAGVVGLLLLVGRAGLPLDRATVLRQDQAVQSIKCALTRSGNLSVAGDCTDIHRSRIRVRKRPSQTTTTKPSTTTTTKPSTSTTQTAIPPSTAAPSGTNRSGLAWSSGAVGDAAGFATWRGRPLDNTTTWPNRSNWNEISHPDIYGAVSATPPEVELSLGLAMLPDPANGATFAQCAAGAYDQYYRTYGSELVRLGRVDSVVRLGWEANGDWYSWSIRNDVANYKACFRHEVAAIQSTNPRVRIDWNMNKDSHMDVSVVQAYPGDDVVDIVGVDFYDMWPAYPDQTAWNTDYLRTQNGGPRGLGAWLAFAKAHGKPLSVPEWGTTPPGSGGGGDHTTYIQAMQEFFANHADDIAYETYFNIHPGFRLWPSPMYPLSAGDYQARF
jgi:hypothetical protein